MMPTDEVRELLSRRLAEIRARIAAACERSGRDKAGVKLIGVTKTVSSEIATIFHGLGINDLAESRPQELWKKQAAIPNANWHLIGHLQRNKIDKTIPIISRIHSVDSERLLAALDDFCKQRGILLPALLEVNCSREESKGGFTPEDLPRIANTLASLSGVRVEGLMTMAAHHDDPELCRNTFIELRTLRDELKSRTGLALPHLSMGMSNDFEVAIEEGATFVRLGTTLFAGLSSE